MDVSGSVKIEGIAPRAMAKENMAWMKFKSAIGSFLFPSARAIPPVSGRLPVAKAMPWPSDGFPESLSVDNRG